MAVNWGAAGRPKQGQQVSGDTYLFMPFGEHGLQVAVIDGLGGGSEAAYAAQGAATVIRADPAADPAELLRRAHLALHGTRGCVLALLTFDTRARTVVFIGVGNIGAQVYSSQSIKPISKHGIVGYRMPSQLLKLPYSYNFGDTFVLYSDGVSNRFAADTQLDPRQEPQQFAEAILQHHGKTNDDATVVVVRATE